VVACLGHGANVIATMLLALAMAALRLYMAGDGDGQRDPRQTSGHAEAYGRDA